MHFFSTFLLAFATAATPVPSHVIARFDDPGSKSPAAVDLAIRALVADERRIDRYDDRARLIRRLVEATRDVSAWPAEWRAEFGPGLSDSLDRLLRRFQRKHAQLERVVDLFDQLDLWGPAQADWLTTTYANKLWPRLVAPWLRALEAAPAATRADVARHFDRTRHTFKTNFIARAVLFRIDPPATAAGVHKFLDGFAADAAGGLVHGAARQGYRVTSAADAAAGEKFRREVNRLFREVFVSLRERRLAEGPDGEVAAAFRRARTPVANDRRPPAQRELLRRLVDLLEEEDLAHLEAFLDVGCEPELTSL